MLGQLNCLNAATVHNSGGRFRGSSTCTSTSTSCCCCCCNSSSCSSVIIIRSSTLFVIEGRAEDSGAREIFIKIQYIT